MELDFLSQFNPEAGSGANGLLDATSNALLGSGNPYAMAAGAVTKFGAEISNMFGKGRREADAIVPIQNQLDDEILKPVGAELQDPSTPLDRLIELRGYLKQGLDQFEAFLKDPRWSADGDNRAANGAHDTIIGNPGYGTRLLEHLDQEIASRGGYVPGSTAGGARLAPAQGNIIPLALAAGAFFLFK